MSEIEDYAGNVLRPGWRQHHCRSCGEKQS